jgi:bile acid:Na+ symporter, BASS family
MLLRIKHLIESNLFGVILVAFALGLTLPGLEHLPAWLVFGPVMGLVYVACARVSLAEIRSIRPVRALGFYAARFVALPFVLYGGASLLIPSYKEAVLLIALSPASITAAAWVGAWGGSTSLALGYIVVSSLLVPFVVPTALTVAGLAGGGADTWPMFWTLTAVILFPIAAYFFVTRPFPRVVEAIRGAGPLPATLFMVLVIILPLGHKRAALLADPLPFLGAVAVMMVVYALFAAFGWLYPARSRAERVAHAVSTGLNNNSLMIGLASAYFAPHVTLALLSTSIVWNGTFLALKRLLGPR